MATKLLYKSEDNRKIDGVCSGIAEYFEVDPTLVRAAYAFVDIVTGVLPGLVAYFVMSWIMPRKSEVAAHGKE